MLVRPSLIPFVPDVPGLRFQAVHADDVGDAYRRAVVGNAEGAFNIAASPTIGPPELAALLRARKVKVPARALRAAASLTWRAHLQPADAGWIDLALNCPLMDVSRAKRDLGWEPRASSSTRSASCCSGSATEPAATRRRWRATPAGRCEVASSPPASASETDPKRQDQGGEFAGGEWPPTARRPPSGDGTGVQTIVSLVWTSVERESRGDGEELSGSLSQLPEGSNLTHTPSAGRTRSLFALERRYAIGLACLFSLLVMLGLAGRASALNYVYDTNQDFWAVNDAAIPGLDTGSIQSTATKSLQGYGGIRMQVDGAAKTPVLNGVMLRGFGDTYDGSNSFSSHHAVELGGVAVTRSLTINQEKNYARFYDTFTNESRSALSVDIDFGGQLGYHLTTPTNHQSTIFASSSGDAAATSADTWVAVDTPSELGNLASASQYGPSATVLGTVPIEKTSDFLVDPFNKPLQENGSDEANEYGYINHFTLQPGQTRSLVHFVVIGLSEKTESPAKTGIPAAGSQKEAVKTLAAELTATPDLSGLTTGQLCSIVNWTEASIKAFKPTYNPAECVNKVITNAPAPVVEQPEPTTNSPYNVVGKSITEELAAMKSGETTSAQITKAYLDRIAAYNDGPLGFHALISVNPHALEEARKDDQLRAEGDTAPLLGIPIAAKDIYDTTEMPTTGGSLVFENYVPEKNSFIVQQLINAGAIIIGKANLSEFANSGFYSASAYGQVWNAFDPSKASIGSSGGSAVAVATNMAAAALGTQTGDSLWGPSSAASLVALRGTDGLTTCQGVMPLTYIQDFCGVITRTTEDQALVLNSIAAHDPGEYTQELEGAGWEGKRPTDWSSYLKTDALEGKTIGWEDEAWTSPWGDEGNHQRDEVRVQIPRSGRRESDPHREPADPAGESQFQHQRRHRLRGLAQMDPGPSQQPVQIAAGNHQQSAADPAAALRLDHVHRRRGDE